MKKLKRALLLLFVSSLFVSCTKPIVKVENLAVSQEEQFGSVNFDILNEQFKMKGFNFGDSVDVSFDNGVHFEDLPYYDGLYAKSNEMILLSHPTAKVPALNIVNGASAWLECNLSIDNKATITLNEKAKYKDIQDIMSVEYSRDRNDYESDEVFANFRVIKGGKIKDDLVYRGCSPIDNAHNRSFYGAKLVEKNGIKFIVDLADNDKKYKKFLDEGTISDYVKNIHDSGKMMLLGLGGDFSSEKSRKLLARAFKAFAKNGEKVYIHCQEGKDRAGFVSALVLALANANSKEIANDYMTTYKNYYNLTEESNKKKYDAIYNLKVPEILQIILDDPNVTDFSNVSFQNGAKEYLKSGGLTDAEVEEVVKFLTK